MPVEPDRTQRPPEAWAPAMNLARAAAAPIERFFQVEAASGIVLIAATIAALGWANSPWRDSYHHLWHTEISLGIGTWSSKASLHFLINEGLMTLFFFIVGLEIRREMHHGELSRLRSAVLPIGAALGGMVVPAAIFVALNRTGEASRAWGIPMATDIAFAVGILTLLGKRVPPALRVMLLALAIIDDIGAIVVIAIFFSKGIALDGIAISVLALAAILGLQRFGARLPAVYVAPSALLWFGLLRMGIHPTIGGVVAGLLTPVTTWFGPGEFAAVARKVAARVEDGESEPHRLRDAMRGLGVAHREALAPGIRLQLLLHPWVSFLIMPLFAFANAGIALQGFSFIGEHRFLTAGVVLGLVVGKPLGIVFGSLLVVKLKMTALPTAVTWKGVLLVGLVGGIGFTMAIFIAGLALTSGALLETAKLCVLIGSAIAAVAALVFGRITLREVDACAASESEASLVD
jgi:NhaA family Na+:H+ antiporter